MKDSPLGKNSHIPTEYDSSLLIPLSRLDSRVKSGLQEFSSTMHGKDYWTSYEASWLNSRGIPQNRILNITYNSDSKYFVESKSLKLYLYSLNNKKFNTIDEVSSLIQSDLEQTLKTEVEVDLVSSPRSIEDNHLSLDSLAIEKIDSYPNSLVIEPEEKEASEDLSCSLFRSLCPVTAQPDWATIYISYSGIAINHLGLLRYLLSYRNHQGFHEECVERIFVDINKRCRLDKLSVRANFLRRGGIEINPVRTSAGLEINMSREERQ
jgi:7-cyano-7-deazaguanine reductase